MTEGKKRKLVLDISELIRERRFLLINYQGLSLKTMRDKFMNLSQGKEFLKNKIKKLTTCHLTEKSKIILRYLSIIDNFANESKSHFEVIEYLLTRENELNLLSQTRCIPLHYLIKKSNAKTVFFVYYKIFVFVFYLNQRE